MRRIVIKVAMTVLICSVIAIFTCSCSFFSLHDNQSKTIANDNTNRDDNDELEPEPTLYVDYSQKSEYLINTEALLEAVELSAKGEFPEDTSKYSYIFNRFYISQYADTDVKKSIVLGMYISMLTSQPCYIFSESAGITQTEFRTIITLMKADCPEFMHLGDSYTRYSNADTGIVSKVEFEYKCSSTEYYERLSATLNEIDNWATDTDDKSVYDKEFYVYNNILDKCEYTLEGDSIASAYGAIVNGKALCEGYSKAFMLSMYCMGINCIQINGEAVNSENVPEMHAWNYVQLDGNWYATDITWDDSADSSTGPIYAYMNITTEEISRNHEIEDLLLSYNLPECTSRDLNYHVVNGNLVSENDSVKHYIYDILDDKVTSALVDDSFVISLKLEDTSDYEKLVENLDTWLYEWNEGRYIYVSKYIYTGYSDLGVIKLIIEVSEV